MEKISKPDIVPLSLYNLMISRRSTRKYKKASVPEETIQQLLDVAVHAGSGGNKQTEGFIIIQNRILLEEMERRIIDVLWNGGIKYLGRDSLIVKLLGRKYGPELIVQYKNYHDIIKHRRQNNDIKGMIFRNAPLLLIMHSLKNNALGYTNAAIALRNIELFGATLGIASCWSGFLVAAAKMNPKAINPMLNLDHKRIIVGGLMLGYPKFEFHYRLPRKKRDIVYL
jgi:nitroreductase